jgi:catechol 2,3-dioxygenase-like lactoylglutathione lyase family enzyme
MSQSQLSSLNVKTIDHVTLVVKDLERSRRFYRDLLGMAETTRPNFGFPGLWFQAGDTQIHMNVEGPDAGPAGMAAFQGTSPSRGFHFAFEVESCDGAAQQLRQMGVEIVAGPRNRPDGPRQLYIYDPDHYLVEIYSRS